mmetsp:Transcript_16378/g.20409  ORF Transcript_16378/g.20409 Transcript_16378/m.20409 type:complete len:512 (-) Transcript_16378:122-1657(-)|eukprot:CAMPEP_0172510918 /NCGR_PEP_ID=MMETSP1066-20121228/232360_1 /TAXON_ID=671091 /ORGANISM="Coscinodiscus wailesii, Strain CCMP2513" /LENGTH=511 /DNA_ID=CAMNT_0013290087 /DNA_START=383 /DNA_END=1918 /DNA_ORIENTATION=+
MHVVTSSSNGKPIIVIALSASVVSLYYYSALKIFPKLKNRRRKNDKQKLEIYAKTTERNKHILADAHDLVIESWAFRNCHLSSILAQVRPPPLLPSPFLGRWGRLAKRRTESIQTPSAGSIEVEYIEPTSLPTPPPPSTPIIIILHGVSGHSREPYIEQAALHIAVERQWRALIFNYGKIRLNETSAALYGGHNFMDGGDVNFLISRLRKEYPSTFIAAVGFSMGGAKLVQYLTRTGEHCNLDAACAISSPLDFTARNVTVYGGNWQHKIYHFAIAAALKLWIVRNWRALTKHPKISAARPFRKTRSGLLWWFRTCRVTDVDQAITMHAKGYTNLDDYYRDASVVEKLRHGVAIPFLCLTAKNDPFVPAHIIPGEDIAMDNENIFIVNTETGGHIGFWVPGKGCWATRACLSFLDSVKKNVPSTAQSRSLRRQASLKAAERLKRTSSNKLTNYIDLLDSDSCPDFGAVSNEPDERVVASPTRRASPSCSNTPVSTNVMSLRNRIVVQGGWV